MQIPKFKFKNTSGVERRHLKIPGAMATSALLCSALNAQTPIPVSNNGDLNNFLPAATNESHTFQLLGNATLGHSFELKDANHSIINIYGVGPGDARSIISRSNQEYRFYLEGEGSSLTIQNAIITSSDTTRNSNGAVYTKEGRSNVYLNFDGSIFEGNRGNGGDNGGAITSRAQNTVVDGNIIFRNNYGHGTAAGAVLVRETNANLTFNGQVDFINNTTADRGGAISIEEKSSMVFKDVATFTGNSSARRAGALWLKGGHAVFEKNAVFTGNHSTAFGGAINLEYTPGYVEFQENATFTNNYVTGSDNGQQPRGGAVAIGTGEHATDSAMSELTIRKLGTFSGNYALGLNSINSYGGAIALTGDDGNPMGNTGNSNHKYSVDIKQGVFEDNYAYSENGSAYGGAVFASSYDATLSFGSGSRFEGNAAKTLGGAIYLKQGTINLDGDITFSGNRQNADFTLADDPTQRPALVANSGDANAIYFGGAGSSQPAVLNMTTTRYSGMIPVDGGEPEPRDSIPERIQFKDPIQSAEGRRVTVNHTGTGEVVFSEYNSNILARTTFVGGTFILENNAQYGGIVPTNELGPQNQNGTFLKMDSTSTLRGHDNTYVRANEFELNGRIESMDGVFYLEGGNVLLSSTSVIAIHIFADGTNSYINVGGNTINLNDAELDVTAHASYVPSQDVSDTFILVANLSAEPTGEFKTMSNIMINGAAFEVRFDQLTNNLILSQTSPVPEPSTFALLIAVGCAGFAWSRRKRKSATFARA